MKQEIERKLRTHIEWLVKKSGLVSGGTRQKEDLELSLARLTGDGSSREFYRVSAGGDALCLAVAPGGVSEKKLAEARSARLIGSHLHRVGVVVPAQYGDDPESGVILFEDLGDTKLQDLVLEKSGTGGRVDVEALRPWYHQVIDRLVVMQLQGGMDFEPDWCWDGGCYDRNVMLEKESGYFCRSFLGELPGCSVSPGLEEEFVELACRCEQEPSAFFLHRDFQSRNIMIKEGRVRFIDFQGGRLGPLQYDLASLLIDPYVGLPADFRWQMVDYYEACLSQQHGVDSRIRKGYELLAVQRNLQIIGAFSFLSRRRKKVFFKQFIHPALLTLDEQLTGEGFDEFPLFRKMVARAIKLLQSSGQ